MRKQWICGLLAASCVLMTVGGCGKDESTGGGGTSASNSTETSSGSGGTVELRVWAEESNFEMLQKMFDSFKEEYSGQATFEITLEDKADSETRNNVLGDVHNAADVFPMADDQVPSLVAGGALSPVPNADEIKSANLEGSIEAASVNDVLYAYPYSADNGFFLYYDTKYYKESDVQTMDQILKIAEDNGKKFYMDWSSGWYTYAFWGNTGLEFGINDDGVTNYCNWNSEEGAIKGVDVAQAMLAISASPAFQSSSGTPFTEGAKSGEYIAGVSGVWDEPEIRAAWGDGYGAVKLPTYTVAGKQLQMTSFKGYKMFGVNAYSGQSAWAHKLAEWLSNEENQTLRFVERSQGPSNIKASASEEVGKNAAIKAVQDQAEFGVLQRVGNSYWGPTSDFGVAMAEGNPSGTNLQELLDTMVAGVTASSAN